MRFTGKNIGRMFSLLLTMVLIISITGLQKHFRQCLISGNIDYIIALPGTVDYYTVDFDCQCGPVTKHEQVCESCHANEPFAQNETGCCESGTELIMIDLEYVANASQKTITPKAIDLNATAFNITNEVEEAHEFEHFYKQIDPPPKSRYYGKYVLIALNQLKIPSA